MKQSINYSTVLVTFLLLFSSCNNNDASKKLKILTEEEAVNIQQQINLKDDDGIAKSGKSSAEKQWRKLYKLCGKSFIFQNPIYLGLSNNNGIGLILNKDGGILRLPPEFSKQDSNGIIKTGAIVPICKEDINQKFDFNLLFSGIFETVSVDSFGTSFSRSKSKTITSGNWYQVDLAQDTYYEFISSHPGLAAYKASLDKADANVVTSALYVSNFSADLDYDTEANLGLKLKLDSVYSASIISGKGQMKIMYKGNKKISISCTNLFVPLVVLGKK